MKHLKSLVSDRTKELDKICKKHNINLLTFDGKEYCPRCENEKSENALQDKLQKQYDEYRLKKKYYVLDKKSLVPDKTLLKATFKNFSTESERPKEKAELVANRKKAYEQAVKYKNGETFNTFIQSSKTGVGKSHLAYSMLKYINENCDYRLSCLFVSIESVTRKIKDSFNNKESPYTEDYFIDLLGSVDVLVIDDLGAEVGKMSQEVQASNFIQRVIYAISTERQDKATIITTNLSSKALQSIYDPKSLSRLWRGVANNTIIFEQTTNDRRFEDLPF